MTTHAFIFYNPISGRVSSSGKCNERDLEHQRGEAGEERLDVEEVPRDTTAVYVLDGVIVERPPFPATLSGTTLTGVPVPSALWINGKVYDAQSDTVTLNFPKAGVYKLVLDSWPYLTGNYEVTV